MESIAAPNGERIRVLVSDSNHIHTQLLAEALQRDASLDVIPSCGAISDLTQHIKSRAIQLAVLSTTLAGQRSSGFEALRQLRAMDPQIRCIMLLDAPDRETVLEAFRAGARGMFDRSQSIELLTKCVHRVHEGQNWASGEHMTYAAEALASAPVIRANDASGFALLSPRELEVVSSLSQGLTNREIADKMGLSQHTIKNYVFKIFEKLGVTSRVELLFMTLSQAGKPAHSPSDADPQDAVKAVVDLNGAEQGYPGAQFDLAKKLRDGIGVAKDLVSAYAWLLVCEHTSSQIKDEAASERKALARQLDPTLLARAQEKAREYLAQIKKMPSRDTGARLAQVVGFGAVCVLAGFIKLL